MTLPTKIVLADLWDPLIRAWTEAFSTFEHVQVRHGDFFAGCRRIGQSPPTVSGLWTAVLMRPFELDSERTHRYCRAAAHRREVTTASCPWAPPRLCRRDTTRWPFLVVAPTMRVPESVGQTLNAGVSRRHACDFSAQPEVSDATHLLYRRSRSGHRHRRNGRPPMCRADAYRARPCLKTSANSQLLNDSSSSPDP